MLPAAARLRRSEDFRAVMRRGAKAGRRRLVVHALTTDPPDAAEAARAGFVVSKAVGNSVVRHRVTRRLRHLVSARLGTLPPGSSLVIRALPPAADASSAELGSDLDASLRRLGLSGKSRQTRPPDNGSAV
ncbi:MULTISPECIES: ribonuclease P protein component [Amycolatopsis]|uniref:ribonuclease P protein component n=1 Tax=Amycolatopsis TaxID=1813 RepID=UPI000F85E02A|nr:MULTISPECIES: ribonuclease P protein component [Amycolatopsis]QXV60638.1 ribonuclease P protein component [Amycolatopsis sp. TNS106]RSN14944.1 ribonuclease P protein component [Streptomyces sp. WAC 05977]UUV28192.1 ribonuclease P protein component [Amycolatopsis roodepoortensis]